MDYFMWFTTGTESLTSKSNQEHKYPAALQSQTCIRVVPLQNQICLLLSSDYLNTHRNVLITWLWAQWTAQARLSDTRLGGLSRPELLQWSKTEAGHCQELSLVRSSALCRNRRRAPGRSIIPIMLHHKSLKALRIGEWRRRPGSSSDTLSDAPCLPVEDTRRRFLNSICCYDIAAVSTGRGLIRCFLIGPAEHQQSSSEMLGEAVTCQSPDSFSNHRNQWMEGVDSGQRIHQQFLLALENSLLLLVWPAEYKGLFYTDDYSVYIC